MLRRPWGKRRTGDAERPHILVVFPDEALGDLADPFLLTARPVDDLVIDIGEVFHIGDVAAAVTEITGDHIENDRRAGVSHMADVIRRDSANVDPDLPLLQGMEFLFFLDWVL